MTAGLDSPQDTCWYTREVVTLDDLISDIDIYAYYIVTDNIYMWQYYTTIESYLILQVLWICTWWHASAPEIILSDIPPDWANWEVDTLPNLRPRKATCILQLQLPLTMNILEFKSQPSTELITNTYGVFYGKLLSPSSRYEKIHHNDVIYLY